MIHLFTDKKSKPSDENAESAIINMVDEAHSNGLIEKNEADLIQNILSFGDVDAHEIMTHRSEISGIKSDVPLESCLLDMLTSPYSWYPVYEGNIDTILGIVTIRDTMKEYLVHPKNRGKAIADIQGLLRDATIFPESRSIASILRYMLAAKTKIVLIVDEYGQTSGLISKTDILEEIASDILDHEPDQSFIQQGLNNSIVMDGLTPLDKAEEVLHVKLDTDNYETLSGYLTALLGHVPTAADKTVRGEHFLFHILKVENHTIRKVRAERIPEEEVPGKDTKADEAKVKKEEEKEQ